jgi:hypothetical protein
MSDLWQHEASPCDRVRAIMTLEFAYDQLCDVCEVRIIFVLVGAQPIAILCSHCDGPEVDAIVAKLGS